MLPTYVKKGSIYFFVCVILSFLLCSFTLMLVPVVYEANAVLSIGARDDNSSLESFMSIAERIRVGDVFPAGLSDIDGLPKQRVIDGVRLRQLDDNTVLMTFRDKDAKRALNTVSVISALLIQQHAVWHENLLSFYKKRLQSHSKDCEMVVTRDLVGTEAGLKKFKNSDVIDRLESPEGKTRYLTVPRLLDGPVFPSRFFFYISFILVGIFCGSMAFYVQYVKSRNEVRL